MDRTLENFTDRSLVYTAVSVLASAAARGSAQARVGAARVQEMLAVAEQEVATAISRQAAVPHTERELEIVRELGDSPAKPIPSDRGDLIWLLPLGDRTSVTWAAAVVTGDGRSMTVMCEIPTEEVATQLQTRAPEKAREVRAAAIEQEKLAASRSAPENGWLGGLPPEAWTGPQPVVGSPQGAERRRAASPYDTDPALYERGSVPASGAGRPDTQPGVRDGSRPGAPARAPAPAPGSRLPFAGPTRDGQRDIYGRPRGGQGERPAAAGRPPEPRQGSPRPAGYGTARPMGSGSRPLPSAMPGRFARPDVAPMREGTAPGLPDVRPRRRSAGHGETTRYGAPRRGSGMGRQLTYDCLLTLGKLPKYRFIDDGRNTFRKRWLFGAGAEATVEEVLARFPDQRARILGTLTHYGYAIGRNQAPANRGATAYGGGPPRPSARTVGRMPATPGERERAAGQRPGPRPDRRWQNGDMQR